MAELAVEDPEDTIIPLLEGAIAYLCLPRNNPPGGPSVIGMEIFGDGVSTSAKKTKITSLRAACVALATKKKKKGSESSAAATSMRRTGTKPISVSASVDKVAALLPSSSPSPPRKRPASPPANTASPGGRQLQKAASAAKAKAAKRKAAKATAIAAELLLPWDAESLASLQRSHQALAATLLRLERISKPVDGAAARENRRSSVPNIGEDAESVGALGCRDTGTHGDETGDQHHRPQFDHSTELLKRADASLTIALAAAGVGVRCVAPCFTADPDTADSAGLFPEAAGIGSKISEAGISPASSEGPPSPPPRSHFSPSRPSPPLNVASDDEGDPRKSTADNRSPALSVDAASTVIPVTVLERDEGADRSPADLEEDRFLPEQKAEEGATDDNWLPGSIKRVPEPRQRSSRDGDIAPGDDGSFLATTMAGVDPKTVAELYSMRCAAKEGLGLSRDAMKDCRAALAAVPGAPKLWAKAASLALRLGTDAERRDKGHGNGASQWASEVKQISTWYLGNRNMRN